MKKDFATRLTGVEGDVRVRLPKELVTGLDLKPSDWVIVRGELDHIVVIPAKLVPKVQRSVEG